MPEIIVQSSDNGMRLDVFLTSHLDLSRSQIQKLIKNKEITLNGVSVRPNARIETGGVIFFPEEELIVPTKTGEAPLLDVLFEDDNVLVINKPAGLLVHQANPSDTEPTVVDALLEQFPNIAEVGDDPTRPGIVHRLDKDVSGIMVIAKTQKAFEDLKEQFKGRMVEKEYLALVYGQLPEDHAQINLKIARSKLRGRMVARTEQQEGKESKTEYYVLERLPTTTFVRVRIHTGRTHQIRVHFHALGHSVVGDKLYKIKRMKQKPIELDRIFLHAQRLSFTLPNGERKIFETPLPEELQTLLRQLKK